MNQKKTLKRKSDFVLNTNRDKLYKQSLIENSQKLQKGQFKNQQQKQKLQPEYPINEYRGFKIPCNNWQPDKIDSAIDPELFFMNYVWARKPCIFKGFLQDKQFENVLKMSKEDLIKKSGSSIVEIEKRESEKDSFGTGRQKEKMSFEKFLNLEKDAKIQYYMTTQNIDYDEEGPLNLSGSPFLELFDEVDLRPKILGNLVPNQFNIWMGFAGEKGSSTGLHHDYHDNIYIVMKGKKKFEIYSPSDANKLITYGKIKKVHPNGLISYDLEINSDGHYDKKNDKRKKKNSFKEDNEQNKTDQIAQIESQIEELQEQNLKSNKKLIEKLENQLEELLNQQLDDFVQGKIQEDDYQDENQENQKLENPDNFVCASQNIINSCNKGIIEIQEGQMLYLPASYYHHVYSFGDTHMAINIWMHPPDQNNFFKPYRTNHWNQRYQKMLENTMKLKQDKKNI